MSYYVIYSFKLKSAFASGQLFLRLWLNDTSYSKGVWRSEEEVPLLPRNTTLQLSTRYTDSKRFNSQFSHYQQQQQQQQGNWYQCLLIIIIIIIIIDKTYSFLSELGHRPYDFSRLWQTWWQLFCLSEEGLSVLRRRYHLSCYLASPEMERTARIYDHLSFNIFPLFFLSGTDWYSWSKTA